MKNLLPLLAIVLLASCEKEKPAPSNPGGPTTPTTPANYFVLNGDGHTDDTVAFTDQLNAQYFVSASKTGINGLDTTSVPNDNFFIIWFPGATAGTQTLTGSTDLIVGENYSYNAQNMQVTIDNYGAIGQPVTGSYTGTMTRNSGSIVVNVTGKFSIVRGADQ